MNTTETRLTGEALLRFVKDRPNESKTSVAIGAGYVRDTGLSKTAAFTAFYEALLDAKKEAGELTNGRILSDKIPTHDGPAIYVACLASYNSGTLYGRWISLEWCQDADEIRQAIAEVLKGSPTPDAEEYAIHDSQCLPECLGSTEWPDIDELNSFAEVSANVDDREPYLMACDDAGRVLSEDEFRECYWGHYSSPAVFAQDYYEQQGREEDSLSSYIDWDRVWNGEFDCNGWGARYQSGGYHIFSPD